MLIPHHCEAYPSFSAAGAAVHWRYGEPFCEWYDEHGGLAAQLDVMSLDEGELFIRYSCGNDVYRHQRGAGFPVKSELLFSGKAELRALCPACRRIRPSLFFKTGRWACQSCQGLVERRSLLDSEQKLIVKRDKLNEQVHAKPTGSLMAQERRRAELMRINGLLEASPAQLQPPLRHKLRSFWFGDNDNRTEWDTWDTAPAYLDAK